MLYRDRQTDRQTLFTGSNAGQNKIETGDKRCDRLTGYRDHTIDFHVEEAVRPVDPCPMDHIGP